MELVETPDQIRRNIEYFDDQSGTRQHREFVERGICLVAYSQNNGVHFAPSRFLGYQANSFENHSHNEEKNGRDTNPAISKILNASPVEDAELEALYVKYCETLGFEARPTGNFGVIRKFWDGRGQE